MYSRSNRVAFGGRVINQPAFFIGAIAALFGFYGVAHFLNGKLLGGIFFLLLGFVWDALFASIAFATFHLATIPLFLVHLLLIFVVSRRGATR